MKFNKCFFCNKFDATPYELIEVKNGKIDISCYMCKKCGDEFIEDASDLPKKKPKAVDLTQIKTAEDLIDFIFGLSNQPKKDACRCGATVEDFQKKGRFGCPHCYEHFKEKMERLVFPYHRATQHMGKIPVRASLQQQEENLEEKLKLLRLKLAKAVECERYEEAAKLKVQISTLTEATQSD